MIRFFIIGFTVSFLLSVPARAQVTGSILLPEANDGTIVDIRGGGDFTGSPRFATGLSFPTALCQGPGGHIYATESGSGEVTIVTGGGDFSNAEPFATGLSSPFGLYCSDTEIIVTENTTSQITDITSGGDVSGNLPLAVVANPSDVFRDSSGRLWVTSFGGGLFDITAGGAGVLQVQDDGLDDGSIGLTEHLNEILVALWIANRVVSETGAANYTTAATAATVNNPLNLLSVDANTLLVSTWSQGAPLGNVFNISTGAPVLFASGVRPFDVAEMALVTQVCGNSQIEGNEACDDGNTNTTDACTNECQNARCGDGFVQSGVEECDDGNASFVDACLPSCTLARCGDTFTHVGVEQCDDGNAVNEDGCTTSCFSARCGDGFIWDGVEECDDGNIFNSDLCTSVCLNPICGDGFIQTGVEECDDANLNDLDDCRNTCMLPVCGNLIVDPAETCDDGNLNNNDDCLNSCIEAICGDGIVNFEEEECDDQNINALDDCSNDCQTNFCGDGRPKLGEACDDGNDSDNDECRTDCVVATCGDGFLLFGTEDCDDGNLENGDGCTEFCFKEFSVCGCQNSSPKEWPILLFSVFLAFFVRRKVKLNRA